MFNRLSSWFSNLTGPKKVAAVVVAIATGIGAVLGAVNGSIDLYERLTAHSRATNKLELVDLGFTTVARTPALDVKVTNAREDPIFIKRVDFTVKQIWRLRPPYFYDKCYGAFMAPTHKYKITLPTKGAPYTVAESLSQSVGPDESDRFTILPETEESPQSRYDFGSFRGPPYEFVFLMTVSLVHGGEDRTLPSKDLLYMYPAVTGRYRPDDCYTARNDLDRLKEQNERTIAEIERIEAPANLHLQWVSHTLTTDSSSPASDSSTRD
jgi:hypothetical protein